MCIAPMEFLGPLPGKRILVCGVGLEAVGFAKAGADVYGLDPLVEQVQAIKDFARGLGLRDRTHLQPMVAEQLTYPGEFFDLILGKTIPESFDAVASVRDLARVMKQGGRAAFMLQPNHPAEPLVRRAFEVRFVGDGWIGVENSWRRFESHWSDLNRRPLDYESRALPLSYSGGTSDALARIRTATPFGTTPSR